MPWPFSQITLRADKGGRVRREAILSLPTSHDRPLSHSWQIHLMLSTFSQPSWAPSWVTKEKSWKEASWILHGLRTWNWVNQKKSDFYLNIPEKVKINLQLCLLCSNGSHLQCKFLVSFYTTILLDGGTVLWGLCVNLLTVLTKTALPAKEANKYKFYLASQAEWTCSSINMTIIFYG